VEIKQKILGVLKEIKREQIIPCLMQVALSIFAGTWVIAFIMPFDEGALLVHHLASVTFSCIVLGKAILSLGISWLLLHFLEIKPPMKPVQLYWLYVAAAWVFTLAGVI